MKKVIAAAAAFAMVAGIASVASAAVDLSGDARFRFRYQDNYTQDRDETKWDSRVRVVVAAKSNGGAYAKARIRMWDNQWDGVDNYKDGYGAGTDTGDGNNNIWVDYAYLGAPIGNGWSIQGGHMPISFSRWFTFDERADRFALINKKKGQVFAFTYDKVSEGDDSGLEDDDKNKIGIKYLKDVNETVKVGLRAVYVQDETAADKTGMVGSAYVNAKAAGGNIYAELAYKDKDTFGGADNAMGGYVNWTGKMGSMSPDLRLGFTKDGYKADDDFGWLMIGFAEPITAIATVGQTSRDTTAAADTVFASASNTFQLSEKSSITANLVYMDIDAADAGALELSASYAYQLSDGATLYFNAGMLDDDTRSDNIIGAYGKLEISY